MNDNHLGWAPTTGAVDTRLEYSSHTKLERTRWKWWTITTVCLATFMLIAFIMMLPIALPDLQRELGATFNQLQWVVDAYTVPLAALLLVAGSVADRIGRKTVFAGGLALGTVAAAASIAAPNMAVVLIGCAMLGTGAAMTLATSLALISHDYQGEERTRAFGLWGTAIAAALAAGPLAGGFLVSFVGWRGVFAMSIPISSSALAIALLRCHNSRNLELAATRLDWAGSIALCGCLFALIYDLTVSGGANTVMPTLAEISSAALLAAFVVIETRLAGNPRRPPILDLRVFLVPTLSGAAIVAATMAFANFGLTFYITIFFANVQHDAASVVGLKLLSITGASVVASWAAGELLAAVPARRLLIVAMGLIVTGDIWLAVAIAPTAWITLLPGFALVGLGAGVLNPPLGVIAVAAMRPEQSGLASGINNTFRQVGTALGIALLGAIFQKHLGSYLSRSIGSVPSEIVALVASGRFDQAAAVASPDTAAAMARLAPNAFASGLRVLFVVMAGVAAAGLAAALLLIRPSPTRQSLPCKPGSGSTRE